MLYTYCLSGSLEWACEGIINIPHQCRRGNWGPERLSEQPKETQLIPVGLGLDPSKLAAEPMSWTTALLVSLCFFFFYRFIYFFFTELHLLAVQGMLPVRGSWGKSVLGFSLGWFPWVWSRGLEQWLCSCDTWASVLQGLRDLLGPGIKSLSLAWEGRFLTTRPAGKTYHRIIMGYITIQIKTV